MVGKMPPCFPPYILSQLTYTMSTANKKYAELSWGEVMTLTTAILQLPVVLISGLVTSPWVTHNKPKSWKRVLSDTAFRYLTSLSMPQIQKLFGTTLGVYTTWMTQHKLPVVIEELGEEAKLLWIGPKRTDRVVVYCHGGAYFAPMSDSAVAFWRHVQLELGAGPAGIEVGIAIVNYSLVPNAPFPTQLRQAILAIEHILSSGVQPKNIHLVGDSAGANLVLQVLLHTLHPVNSVNPLTLSAPIRGAYLMSPWVSLTGDTGSHVINNKSDVIGNKEMAHWGSKVLVDVPEPQRGYVEPLKAPDSWFKGIDGVVDRILITAGSAECLRDDVVVFGDKLNKHHPDVKVVIQKNGVHNDPYLDFLAMESNLGELTPMIVQWLAAGYDAQFS